MIVNWLADNRRHISRDTSGDPVFIPPILDAACSFRPSQSPRSPSQRRRAVPRTVKRKTPTRPMVTTLSKVKAAREAKVESNRDAATRVETNEVVRRGVAPNIRRIQGPHRDESGGNEQCLMSVVDVDSFSYTYGLPHNDRSLADGDASFATSGDYVPIPRSLDATCSSRPVPSPRSPGQRRQAVLHRVNCKTSTRSMATATRTIKATRTAKVKATREVTAQPKTSQCVPPGVSPKLHRTHGMHREESGGNDPCSMAVVDVDAFSYTDGPPHYERSLTEGYLSFSTTDAITCGSSDVSMHADGDGTLVTTRTLDSDTPVPSFSFRNHTGQWMTPTRSVSTGHSWCIPVP